MNDREHHFSIIKWTVMCLSIGNETRTPYFLASNEQTLNIEPDRAFTRFTKSLIEHCFLNIKQTWTCSSFEPPIFGFKRLNIKFWTSFELRKIQKVDSNIFEIVQVRLLIKENPHSVHSPDLNPKKSRLEPFFDSLKITQSILNLIVFPAFHI